VLANNSNEFLTKLFRLLFRKVQRAGAFRSVNETPLIFIMASAVDFRNKAQTCRSLMRHVTDERTLRVLGEMIAENLAKAQEVECLAIHYAPPLQPSADFIS
jgi:hypothetical protein